MAAKRSRKNLDDLFTPEADSQAAGFFEPAERAAPQRGARVVAVPLSRCLPDRYQARVILPPDLKARFFAGELDCYQVAAELLEAAEDDPGLARQVGALLELGDNMLALGQIEPATGAWVSAEGGPVFALEVGERRFWALALAAEADGLEEEPSLQVIEQAHLSRARQIAENIQREGNTAVDRARAVAGLILLALEIEPDPEGESDLDYYRRVLAIKRLPSGTWPPVERQLGLSRPTLERHLQILRLPDELVYQAKLYDVPEGRLREIVAAPADQQAALLELAIAEDLTARELQAAREARAPRRQPQRRPAQTPHRQAAGRLRAFVRLARRGDFHAGYEAVASEFSVGARDPQELLEAAEHLEEQARWLRAVYQRRE